MVLFKVRLCADSLTSSFTGRVAARNMAGSPNKPPVEFNTVPFFWTRSFDVSLHYAGHASSFDDVIFKVHIASRLVLHVYMHAHPNACVCTCT